jgi:hypothetical protein
MRTATDERLLALCDRGLAGCGAGDAEAVRATFIQLIGSLDFDYAVAAAGLLRIYRHCIRCVQRRQFETPHLVLEWLRAACALRGDDGGRPAAR